MRLAARPSGLDQAIPLRPEFVTAQDGHTKQDCEIAAAKRWLEKNAAHHAPLAEGQDAPRVNRCDQSE